VSVPTHWSCVIPATPRCQQCGATAAAHGPVIPMQPAPKLEVFVGFSTGDASGIKKEPTTGSTTPGASHD